MQIRLHIKLGGHRTTVSVDKVLSVMLAVKLGAAPDDKRAVRLWLQQRLPDAVGTDKGIGKRTSQVARQMMIEAIADKTLSDAWTDFVISNPR